METVRDVSVTASHVIQDNKRIIEFRHNGLFIGSIDIPGCPSCGSACIQEVDIAWHKLITPPFNTACFPKYLQNVLNEMVEDYAKRKPVNQLRRKFTPARFGNSKMWSIISTQ